MTATLTPKTVMSDPEDRAALGFAAATIDALAASGPGSIQLSPHGDADTVIEIPHDLADLLAAILRELETGNGVTVLSQDAVLTTQEAADLLNVSRPFVVTLINEGALAHSMVGTHRRVLLRDVLAYKVREHDRRLAFATKAAAVLSELGLD